jgi:uncharacterized protein (DUF1684 family)
MRYISLILILAMFGCNTGESVVDPVQYAQEMADWQRSRYQTLKSPDGWLSLIGLEWINEGIHTIGSSDENTLQIRNNSMPTQMATLIRDGSKFKIEIQAGIEVLADDQAIQELEWDYADGLNPTFKSGSVSFFVIKRQDKYALRVRDTQSAVLRAFQGTDFFDVNVDWRKMAMFRPYPGGKDISIQNVSGMIDIQSSPGYLEFEHKGKYYRLDVTVEDDQFFVVFADETNSDTTYGGGRYMYTTFPNEKGIVILDFNKSYNPPCVFTEYATCPLPPPQNILPLKITAGELYSSEYAKD